MEKENKKSVLYLVYANCTTTNGITREDLITSINSTENLKKFKEDYNVYERALERYYKKYGEKLTLPEMRDIFDSDNCLKEQISMTKNGEEINQIKDFVNFIANVFYEDEFHYIENLEYFSVLKRTTTVEYEKENL